MEYRKLDISYRVLDLDELLFRDRELMNMALEVLDNAYSPYSHFKVACAVRTKSGKVFLGTNQENIAYPSGMCAERVALFNAGTSKQKPTSLFIVAKDENDEFATAFPCGACRQVMMEFQTNISKQNIKVMVLTKEKKVVYFESVNDLLPFSFVF